MLIKGITNVYLDPYSFFGFWYCCKVMGILPVGMIIGKST